MKPAATKILVVDDDLRTRALLERYLCEQGFSIIAAKDGSELESSLAQHKADLLVLDIMLPGEDGLSICQRLRGRGIDLPIIMLTARGDEVDRIVGLELGADDYLPKPFSPRELLARIKAVLRRRQEAPHGAPSASPAAVTFGDCTLDLGTRILIRAGRALPLSTGEFAVLEVLVQNPRKPLSRSRLIELARGRECGAFERSMDVQISRLRRLIEDDPSEPRFIQTVWGFGYVFVPEDVLA